MTYPGNTPAERYAAFRAGIEPELLKKRSWQESDELSPAAAAPPPAEKSQPQSHRATEKESGSKTSAPAVPAVAKPAPPANRKLSIVNRKSTIWDQL
jgi:hypothetical protein